MDLPKNRWTPGRWIRALAALLLSAAAAPAVSASDRVGILVMAHGGDASWNQAVEEAVAPLRAFCPARLALGMADRDSLQSGIDRLRDQGVDRIAVVRLFVSAESFREQTEYFLRLRDRPPTHFLVHGGHVEAAPDSGSGATHAPGGHFGQPRFVSSLQHPIPPVETAAALTLNREGLYDAPEMGEVMVRRVLKLSRDPSAEAVLVLAHGEGDDHVNRQWMVRLGELAEAIREAAPFREVRVETLREDWREKREPAERRIREFVASAGRQGRVIVVPFRVHGFGPYHEVLKGLEYAADGRGLLPSPEVTEWIRNQAEDSFRRAGWPSPFPAHAPEDE